MPLLPLVLLLLLPLRAQEAAEAPAAEPAAAEAPVDPVADALSQARALYAQRDRPGKADEAIRLLESALAQDPDNYELLWRLAAFYYWKADTSSGSTKATYGKKGWDYAERAKQANPQGVEGYFWTTACVGAYSEGVGILTAVRQGLADKFESNGLKAVSLGASYDEGGPLRAMGRYYFSLPWPLRDYDKARDYLERAVKAGPHNARNLYYLADLERAEDHVDRAKELLGQVLAMQPAGMNAPDTRLQQRRAQALLAEIQADE